MRRIFENSAMIILVAFVVVGFGYSLYTSLFDTTAENTQRNLVTACNKALARSIIFQNFANEAAAARRSQASEAEAAGDAVAAKNNIATAEKYEKFAHQYDELTTKNCADFYAGS